MYYEQNLSEIEKGKVRHGHKNSIDNEIFTRTMENLANPYYVFKSANNPNSLVAVYDILDKEKNPVMISIEESKDNLIEANFVTSTYGRPINM